MGKKYKLSRITRGLLASVGLTAFVLVSAPALAATAPDLGTAATYGILSSTYTNTAAGTTINGDLGYTTGPAVNPLVSGPTNVGNAAYNQAGLDQGSALATLNAQTDCISLGSGAVALNAIDLGAGPGVFAPGCYTSGGAMNITVSTTVAAFVPPVTPAGTATSSKAFFPTSITAGGVSRLTITLSNNNAGVATLSSPLIDTLPANVMIAPTPNAVTTCGAGLPTAVAGTSIVSLPIGTTIPGGAPGTCTVAVDVTAATAGSYTNTLPVLFTDQAETVAPAGVTLTVSALPPPPASPRSPSGR